MPPLPPSAAQETPRVRLAFTAIAAAAIAVFVVATHAFWVPAHPGDDQNAYLVSGKLLAAHFPPGLAVDDPYGFVGKMWVAAPDGRYYSKYPLGLPALVALGIEVCGPARGARMAYWISPAAMALALAALFNLDRRSRRSLAQTAVLLASWLLLPALQIAYNLKVMHHLTAYDATHESTAFGWDHFARNGWTTVRQLSIMGLWALLPLAVLGLLALCARSWRLAAVMLAWSLPGTLV